MGRGSPVPEVASEELVQEVDGEVAARVNGRGARVDQEEQGGAEGAHEQEQGAVAHHGNVPAIESRVRAGGG